VPDFTVATWLDFALPASTSEAIVSRLNAEINCIGQNPQVEDGKLMVDNQALWLPII
jgi:hypothetical protein